MHNVHSPHGRGLFFFCTFAPVFQNNIRKVVRLHIFNPEHDVALAAHRQPFTPSHACRQIRHDLGFVPALWAQPGDLVLTDDTEAAQEAFRHLGVSAQPSFIDWHDLRHRAVALMADAPLEICPWGWDAYLRRQLLDAGIAADLLPTEARLETIRSMSHRSWAAQQLLVPLRQLSTTVGESFELHQIEELNELLKNHHHLVLKAPWSSSGRGIRYVSALQNGSHETPQPLTPHLAGWVANVLARQGSLVAEPYYDKVLDFGMEFTSDGNGLVSYCGLSVFHTKNGAYTGNLLDNEEDKLQIISRYISTLLIHQTIDAVTQILGEHLSGVYSGPLGVDMMVVQQNGHLMLHPCVELNLRCTMGHTALALAHRLPPSAYKRVMRITYSDKYRLQVQYPHDPQADSVQHE